MDRIDKIRMCICRGVKCNPTTGEVFGVRGNLIKDEVDGYISISTYLNKKRFRIKAHQFIWYWVNEEVVECIDHINGDKKDNRILNLRAVTRQQNQWNFTKAKGYCFDKHSNKYKSCIRINGKSKHIGNFNTELEAREAYLNAKKIFHIYD